MRTVEMGIRDAASKAFRAGGSLGRAAELTGRAAGYGIRGADEVARAGAAGVQAVADGATALGQGARANAPFAALGAAGLATPALLGDEGDDAAAQMTIEQDPRTGERIVKQVINGEVVEVRESQMPPGEFQSMVEQLQARQQQALESGVIGGVGALGGASALGLSPLGRKAGRGIRSAAKLFSRGA